MPDWLTGLLIGSSGGGLVGYLFRGWIDDRFARTREARALRRSDALALRDSLHTFLGLPRAHFSWLEAYEQGSGGTGATIAAAEKAAAISDWVYQNATRYPPERRGPMYLVMNVAHQLARGDRHFLDRNPRGYDSVAEAWTKLDEYAQFLTKYLHDPDGRAAA